MTNVRDSIFYSVPIERKERLDLLVHDELQSYYSVESNKGKQCKDVSLNVALEFSRKGWLYAEQNSFGYGLIEEAMKDPRFKGLIIRTN